MAKQGQRDGRLEAGSGFSRLQQRFAGVTQLVSDRAAAAKASALSKVARREPHGVGEGQPPWVVLLSSEAERAELHRLIRALALDKHAFLDPPPSSVSFKFDVGDPENAGMCSATLKYDPNVGVARKFLVPVYMSEDEFWRNYFYKVLVIRQGVRSRHSGKKRDSAALVELDDAKPLRRPAKSAGEDIGRRTGPTKESLTVFRSADTRKRDSAHAEQREIAGGWAYGEGDAAYEPEFVSDQLENEPVALLGHSDDAADTSPPRGHEQGTSAEVDGKAIVQSNGAPEELLEADFAPIDEGDVRAKPTPSVAVQEEAASSSPLHELRNLAGSVDLDAGKAERDAGPSVVDLKLLEEESMGDLNMLAEEMRRFGVP